MIQCDTNKLADEDKDANSADDEDDGSDDVLEDGRSFPHLGPALRVPILKTLSSHSIIR